MLEKTSTTNLIVIFLVLLAVALGWMYRPQMASLWNSFDMPDVSLSSFESGGNSEKEAREEAKTVKDCGSRKAPKPDGSSFFGSDLVLNCLGERAAGCQSAKALLNDDLFPTNFEVMGDLKTCSFKLSYPESSTLSDITGKKLAGQYVACPLGVVRGIKGIGGNSPKFVAPDKTDYGKYASEIYFYGTLGLFIENNVDVGKIKSLGCSGPYIDSVAASFSQRDSNR